MRFIESTLTSRCGLLKIIKKMPFWPFDETRLAPHENICRCGAQWASITEGTQTLSACRAVLTGDVIGSDEEHYAEGKDFLATLKYL